MRRQATAAPGPVAAAGSSLFESPLFRQTARSDWPTRPPRRGPSSATLKEGRLTPWTEVAITLFILPIRNLCPRTGVGAEYPVGGRPVRLQPPGHAPAPAQDPTCGDGGLPR